MSDPKHNILTLSHAITGRITEQNGSRKVDWDSSKENVETLKAKKGLIMWVRTRMGVAKGIHAKTEFIFSINPLLPPHLRVTVIGLPASKGTKTIESAFPSLDDAFEDWYTKIKKSPWLRRRMAWIKAQHSIYKFNKNAYVDYGRLIIKAANFTKEFDQSNRISKIEMQGKKLSYAIRTKNGAYWEGLLTVMPEISTHVECTFVYSLFVAPTHDNNRYGSNSTAGRLAHLHLETVACQTGNLHKGVLRKN